MRIAVFIFALAVRIAAIELTGAGAIAFGDARDYLDHTASICARGVYPERGNLPFFRAPGLPFFIAAVTGCEPSRTRAIKYALAACDAVSALLIFLIGREVWRAGPPRAPLIAAGLAAVNPFFVGNTTDVRSEPLFMMLLLAAILLVLRERGAPAGVALGLAALTRPSALLCIPLFALFLWWRRKPRTLRGAALLILAASLTLAPWAVRNYLRFHEVILVNDAGGFNFWRGVHPDVARIVETTDRAEFARRSWVFDARTVPAAAAIVDARASTPGARDREWTRMAMEMIRRDPRSAATTVARKAAGYWRPWLHPAEYGWNAVAASAAIMIALYVLASYGLWRHDDRRLVIAVLVFFATMWLAHLPYQLTMRIRSPLTDPLLIAFAAGAVATLTASSRVASEG